MSGDYDHSLYLDRGSRGVEDETAAIDREMAAEIAATRHIATAMDRILDVATAVSRDIAEIVEAERRVITAAQAWRLVANIGDDYYAAAGRLADAVDALNVRRAS